MMIISDLNRRQSQSLVVAAGGRQSYMFDCISLLLEQMHKIRRPKLSESKQRLGTGFDRLVENLLRDPTKGQIYQQPDAQRDAPGQPEHGKAIAHSGTAGATMVT